MAKPRPIEPYGDTYKKRLLSLVASDYAPCRDCKSPVLVGHMCEFCITGWAGEE